MVSGQWFAVIAVAERLQAGSLRYVGRPKLSKSKKRGAVPEEVSDKPASRGSGIALRAKAELESSGNPQTGSLRYEPIKRTTK